MTKKNLQYAIISTVIGVFLFGSWYFTQYQGFWFEIDRAIFYYFNHLMVQSKAAMYAMAFVNLRAFDVVAFLAMLLILFSYYRKSNVEGKRYLFCVGVAMLVSAIILKQFDKLLPIERASASTYFNLLNHDVNFIGQLSGWPAKDHSNSSFPGDHGMMLLIFTVYMWKYIGRDAFLKGLAVFFIFSLPRIMVGAHWFTDIYIGSVSFILVILSWIVLSPASDRFIEWLEPKLPLRFFLLKR